MLQQLTLDKSAIYRIRVKGYLGGRWSDYLGGLSIFLSEDEEYTVTTLSGEVMDQAALIGIINSLYGMGFPLLSVEYQSLP
jgi:hypothetical protein